MSTTAPTSIRGSLQRTRPVGTTGATRAFLLGTLTTRGRRGQLVALVVLLIAAIVGAPSSALAADGSPFTVQAPAEGQVLQGRAAEIRITVAAGAPDGTDPVLHFDDYQVYTPPFRQEPGGAAGEVVLVATLDTYHFQGGPKAVTVVDRAGLVPTSDPVTWTIDNQGVWAGPESGFAWGRVSGTVLIGAYATAERGLDRVEFVVDGAVVATDRDAPWSFSWDTTQHADDRVDVEFRAVDVEGFGWGERGTVTVRNSQDPAFVIESPAEAEQVGEDVQFRILAKDWYSRDYMSEAVAMVDGQPLTNAQGTTALATERVEGTDDAVMTAVKRLRDGAHTVQIVTVGDDRAPSAIRSFNVQNLPAPTIAITEPAPGSVISGVTTVRADLSAARAVKRVELRAGDQLLATRTAAPWEWTVDTRLLPNGYTFLSVLVEDEAGLTGTYEHRAVMILNAQDASALCADVPQAPFADVVRPSAHAAAIDCAVAHELARGRTDTAYDPGALVSRDQMATFIARLIDGFGALPDPATAPDSFPDDNGSPHERNINALAEIGIVSGLGDGTYGKSRPVSRDQMATFLVRATEYLLDADEWMAAQYFTDISYDNSHFWNVNKAAELGIATGAGDRTYAPGRHVPREQMASFLVRTTAAVLELSES